MKETNKIKIFAYTDRGRQLAEKIAETLENALLSDDGHVNQADFNDYSALIFVGAVGIATRMIAPFVKDKLTDPAVIVVDETGCFVIPILSGHVGGANELAQKLAEALGAVPVITTATDVNGVLAVDELAKKNGLEIVGRDNIKKVSGGLLKGKPINIAFDDDVVITGSRSDIGDKVLGLVYQPLVVGLGMRKDKDFEKLNAFFLKSLEEVGASVEDVCGLASIDVKKDEPALRQLSELYNIPCEFFTAAELEKIEGDFEESDFVKATVGVSDVSARAAKALGVRGSFVLKKKKDDGMTISIFKKYRRVTFEY